MAFEHSCTYVLADSCHYDASRPQGLTPPGSLTYGVAATSIYQHLCGHPSDSNVLIRFWPSSIAGSELDGNSHLVVGDAKGHDIHIPGKLRLFPDGRCLGFVANSGTTFAVITDCEGPLETCTYLVRYVAGMVSAHKLIIPSIPIAQVCCIMVDDFKGTVYFLDTYGALHCIPYA